MAPYGTGPAPIIDAMAQTDIATHNQLNGFAPIAVYDGRGGTRIRDLDLRGPAQGAAIRLRGAQDITVTRCAFRGAGWTSETRSLRSPFEPFTRVLADIGTGISAAAFQSAAIDFQRATYAMAAFFERYDCLLTPVLGQPPVRLGAFRSTDRDKMRQRLLAYVAYTPIANVSGQPAMSVPLYWNADGLPIGVQFIGGFADEATLFQLAGQMERARPWNRRCPPHGSQLSGALG